MSDIECPYCFHEFILCTDDGRGCTEGIVEEEICPDCKRRFVFHTDISYTYSAQKADCLNGGEHKWEPTITIPVKYTQMRCSECDETRPFTPEERTKFFERNA